jgi:hypothetical protein
MQAGMGWCATANIVACTACEWMTAPMSSNASKQARWSGFSDDGDRPSAADTTWPSPSITTRSSSVIAA